MIGRLISHYNILEKLGQGGMGVVYKAEDTRLKRTVALKFLPPELTRDPEAKERFIQEAQAASALDHFNICTIHEIDETEDGHLFIVMTGYEGETLNKHAEQKPLPISEIIDMAIQVSQGLAKAHAHGIVHRDIKPANLMITHDGAVKIVDFGLAKLKGQIGLTKAGTTLGTVAYMSPEQTRGDDVDHRTDIWSLGVVLYEMLTRRLPFSGEYEQAVIYSILNEEPKAMNSVPKELQRIVHKALAKNRGERYQHADELAADLKQAREAEQTGQLQPVSIRKQSRRVAFIAIAVGFLSILLLGFLFFKPLLFNQLTTEPTSIAVISFENQTGDKSYDYLQKAIPNLLITSLEQSKDLRVATWERMKDLIKQIRKDDVTLIDSDLGFELCRMEGIDAIVLGSFVKAGNVFATDVKVLEVSSKRMLKSASSRGEGVSSILDKQIDELSRDISRGVGLGERTVQTDQAPIAEVTTTSMEAYNYFLRGHDDLEKFYHDDAIQFLEKAIQHDSTFAVAYLYLARAYSNLLNEKARNAAYEKAKRYSIKSTEKERLFIDAAYAGTIEKNPEQRLYVLKQIARKYPREKRVHYELGTYYSGHEAIEELSKALALDPDFGPAINQIAYEYAEMGAFEKAIDCFKRYAAVSPGDANPLDSMADLFWRMGKLDEAIAKYEEAFEVKPGFSKALESLIYVYAMQEKYSESMRWLDQLIATTTTPGQQAKNYWIKGFFDLWLGKTKQALLDINQARKLFDSVGNKYGIAGTDWLEAYLRNDCGEQERGLECYQKWLVYLRDNIPAALTGFIPRYNLYRGLINLKQGQIDSARSRLAEIKSFIAQQSSPATRAEIAYRYELLNGEIALAEGKPNEAIAIFEKMTTQPIPNGPTYPWIVQYSTPFQIDGLARAYLKAGNRDRAVAEYERLITFDPKAMDRHLIHPKYHYHLANVYAEQGLQAKAIAQFQKYLEIWKDADEDLSDRTDAQVKLAKLIHPR